MRLYKCATVDRGLYHRWFAWRPVLTQNKEIVWLETVQRKQCVFNGDWIYRRITE